MKKTQEILGLPIISISDGMEIGKVKNVIINADKGAIDYMLVDSGIQVLSARVMSTADVLGIGEYAVTIEHEGVIKDLSQVPAAIELLQKDVQVKDTRVLTKKGRLIGETGDIIVDEDDKCNIIGLEFIADSTQKCIQIIPRANVITLGKKLIVVTENIESALLDQLAELGSQITVANTNESAFEPVGNIVVEETSAAVEGSNPADLFEQKQKEYLNGRVATETILDDAGNTIISAGAIITEEVVSRAKAANKLVELVMNNKS